MSQDTDERTGAAKRFFDQLCLSERSSAKILESYQDKTLARLIAHAAEHVPFYRSRLAGLAGGDGQICRAAWHKLPVLTRGEVVAGRHNLISDHVPKNHGRRFTFKTSGSSGDPLTVQSTTMAEMVTACALARWERACDLDWAANLAIIKAFDHAAGPGAAEGAGFERRGPEWLAPHERGKLLAMSIHRSAEDQLARLAGHAPLNLITHPSNVIRLARAIARSGQDAPEILNVICVGEPVTQSARAEARAHLNCELLDLYATAETTLISAQCPDGDQHHLQSELALIEIVRDDGSPCDSGELGRVTVTPFYNYAMPLIRYQPGDLARPGDLCACGRILPTLSAAPRPSGLLEPSVAEMERYLGNWPWQVAQTQKDTVELRYVRLAGGDERDVEGAARYLAGCGSGQVNVVCREVPIIGRTAGGKFSHVIDERAPD